MGYYLPFINSAGDWSLARKLYPDSAAYRVTLKSRAKVGWTSSPQWKLWVDTEVDALHCWPTSGNPEFSSYFHDFADAEKIAEPSFWTKPDKAIISNFVTAILNGAMDTAPGAEWLSVPQLPHVDGSGRNKVNRALAEATQHWKSKRGFKGRLILPVIFTNQRQLNNKTERNGKVSLVVSCFEASGADGLWVVDSSLGDQDGTGSFTKRFQGIIRLHEELNLTIAPRTISIAGLYWALNLVLWLVELPSLPQLELDAVISITYLVARNRIERIRESHWRRLDGKPCGHHS